MCSACRFIFVFFIWQWPREVLESLQILHFCQIILVCTTVSLCVLHCNLICRIKVHAASFIMKFPLYYKITFTVLLSIFSVNVIFTFEFFHLCLPNLTLSIDWKYSASSCFRNILFCEEEMVQFCSSSKNKYIFLGWDFPFSAWYFFPFGAFSGMILSKMISTFAF